ncbi:hypothetical protein FRC18_010638 [Serendipita sp. 400]|nr:hypothetical protein FRC18_010638 [Serendipita sp. 400]
MQSKSSFVTATLYSDASRDAPRILRTYRPGKNPDRDSNVKIWEAARATSAAPSYFQAITIKSQDEEEKLVDGGLGCNNPVYQVLEEARDHFPHREIACLVSIGTGIPLVRAAGEESPGYGAIWNLMMNIPVIKGGLDRWKQAQVLERVASTCEYTHQRMCKDARRDPELQGRYYRFNVAQGAQGISLEMWDRLDEVYTHTQNYIQTHDVAGRRVTDILDEVVNILYPGQM